MKISGEFHTSEQAQPGYETPSRGTGWDDPVHPFWLHVGGGSGGVEEGAVPEFEDEEGPDAVAVVPDFGFMFGDEAADFGGVEIAAVESAAVE